jgi:hypothetical protein
MARDFGHKYVMIPRPFVCWEDYVVLHTWVEYCYFNLFLVFTTSNGLIVINRIILLKFRCVSGYVGKKINTV